MALALLGLPAAAINIWHPAALILAPVGILVAWRTKVIIRKIMDYEDQAGTRTFNE